MKVYLVEMFAGSLAITLGVESAMALFWIRGLKKCTEEEMRGKDYGRRLLLVLLANLLTNPPAVLLNWLGRLYLPLFPQWALQPGVEVLVVAAEAFVYLSFGEREQWRMERPVVFSVSANACSWLLGVLWMWIRRSL